MLFVTCSVFCKITTQTGQHLDLKQTLFYLQVPSPPGDEDEDFILIHHSEVQNSDKAEQVYTQLANILKEQYEVNKQL